MRKPIYDNIGQGYASRRRADPGWQALIHRRLAGKCRLLNVGAGTGSYEPDFMPVVALEPAHVMLAQRAVTCYCGRENTRDLFKPHNFW